MHGKVVVVTGAAGGIGSGLVAQLLDAGATVWGWDRDEMALKRIEEEASKQGKDFHASVVDVSQLNALREAREHVLSESGKIDIWINNAGVAYMGDFLKMKWEELETTYNVNFLAAVRGTRLALEHMEDRGTGCIVNIASVAGHLPAPFLSAYAATKHGLVGLTRSLRQELKLKSSSVKTLLVCPGFVNTAMIAKGQKAGFPEWLSWTLGTTNQVAASILTAIQKEKEEIYPTWNGRAMLAMNKVIPERLSLEPSKMAMAPSFKDYLLNRYKEK